MKAWQEDQLSALVESTSEHSCFQALSSHARELGFEYCSYGVRSTVPLSNPKVIMFSDYPMEWKDRYEKGNYLGIDPTVEYGRRSLLPIVWTDDLFASTPDFWEEAKSFGLRVGRAQACRDTTGMGGLVTLARSGDPFSKLELQETGLKMHWLAHVTHLCMAKHLAPKLMPESAINLTEREIAVLRWTAEGKTSSEISTILGVTERTINFHITNTMEKLNAVNKTSAAIRAAMLGLLY